MSGHTGKSGPDMVLTPEILGELIHDLAEGIRSLKSGGKSPFVVPGSQYGLAGMESDLEFFSNLAHMKSDPDVICYYACY